MRFKRKRLQMAEIEVTRQEYLVFPGCRITLAHTPTGLTASAVATTAQKATAEAVEELLDMLRKEKKR